MFIINGKQYRTPTQQIGKNKDDIADLMQFQFTLEDYGIHVVGEVKKPSDLPVPYEGSLGDAFAVGIKPPYDFYLWSKTETEPAWFNLGPIAIAGPKGADGKDGAQGPIGPRGPEGQRGRTGLTGQEGPQGIPGKTGSIGPQGPKGDTGDVGGFINVRGILTSTTQLPTPSSLGNLTYAYLVGAKPYNLYIQVGSTSATAKWEDMGPLNVATYVTVNGKFQNTWNADTKADKQALTNLEAIVDSNTDDISTNSSNILTLNNAIDNNHFVMTTQQTLSAQQKEQVKTNLGLKDGGGKLYEHKITGGVPLSGGSTVFYTLYYISTSTNDTHVMQELKQEIENGMFISGSLTISEPGNEWYGIIGTFSTNAGGMGMPPQCNSFMVNTETGAAKYEFITFTSDAGNHIVSEIK